MCVAWLSQVNGKVELEALPAGMSALGATCILHVRSDDTSSEMQPQEA